MQLAEHVAPRGAQTELARAIGCPSQMIWQWANKVRAVPVERCPAIERASGGAVSCEELRPDVPWVRVPDASWPWNPAGKPLLDVAAAKDQQQAA